MARNENYMHKKRGVDLANHGLWLNRARESLSKKGERLS